MTFGRTLTALFWIGVIGFIVYGFYDWLYLEEYHKWPL